LASTAAALGYQVTMFFTFYGLQLLKKKLDLKVSPLGNPGMPMPMGMNSWFPVLGTAIPGMETMMTGMMKNTIKSKGVATIEELRDLCLEADAKLIGCQMTIDLFDMKREDFIDDIDIGGAATYFEHAGESNVNLFI
jgi:peroxiredoxin family protein